MKIRIKRVDKDLPLPEYKTEGAAAFDLYTREKITIPAQGWARAPSNIVVKIPEKHGMIISARSSLAKNYPGIFIANGIGLVDSDFCGTNDEILLSLYNFSKDDITINRGDRIAQAFIFKYERFPCEEIEEMEDPDRGGFGSTGLD